MVKGSLLKTLCPCSPRPTEAAAAASDDGGGVAGPGRRGRGCHGRRGGRRGGRRADPSGPT